MEEQQRLIGDVRQDVTRLERDRADRQLALQELTAQYDKDSQQLTEVSAIVLIVSP